MLTNFFNINCVIAQLFMFNVDYFFIILKSDFPSRFVGKLYICSINISQASELSRHQQKLVRAFVMESEIELEERSK